MEINTTSSALSAASMQRNAALESTRQVQPQSLPVAPAPNNRAGEAQPSVEVQISSAAREAAARDSAGSATGTTSPQADAQPVMGAPTSAAAMNSPAEERAEGRNSSPAEEGAENATTTRALRMFMDNAGTGVEAAGTGANAPLRASA